MGYEVSVFRQEGDEIFSTLVTLVRVDEKGHKQPLPSIPGSPVVD
ncbi:MAG: hypothetical protein R3F31_26100 [Verrucomicrobiales bacterium]